MCFHGAIGEKESASDFSVAMAKVYQSEDFRLSCGDAVCGEVWRDRPCGAARQLGAGGGEGLPDPPVQRTLPCGAAECFGLRNHSWAPCTPALNRSGAIMVRSRCRA